MTDSPLFTQQQSQVSPHPIGHMSRPINMSPEEWAVMQVPQSLWTAKEAELMAERQRLSRDLHRQTFGSE